MIITQLNNHKIRITDRHGNITIRNRYVTKPTNKIVHEPKFELLKIKGQVYGKKYKTHIEHVVKNNEIKVKYNKSVCYNLAACKGRGKFLSPEIHNDNYKYTWRCSGCNDSNEQHMFKEKPGIISEREYFCPKCEKFKRSLLNINEIMFILNKIYLGDKFVKFNEDKYRICIKNDLHKVNYILYNPLIYNREHKKIINVYKAYFIDRSINKNDLIEYIGNITYNDRNLINIEKYNKLLYNKFPGYNIRLYINYFIRELLFKGRISDIYLNYNNVTYNPELKVGWRITSSKLQDKILKTMNVYDGKIKKNIKYIILSTSIPKEDILKYTLDRIRTLFVKGNLKFNCTDKEFIKLAYKTIENKFIKS